MRLFALYESPRRVPAHSGARCDDHALQQLFVFNSSFLAQQGTALAIRVASESDSKALVRGLYRRVLARDPDSQEMDLALSYLKQKPACAVRVRRCSRPTSSFFGHEWNNLTPFVDRIALRRARVHRALPAYFTQEAHGAGPRQGFPNFHPKRSASSFCSCQADRSQLDMFDPKPALGSTPGSGPLPWICAPSASPAGCCLLRFSSEAWTKRH